MTYDLTPDAEGLSKAVATMTLDNGAVLKGSESAPAAAAKLEALMNRNSLRETK